MPSAAGLNEDSTCADYLHVSEDARATFIEHEMQIHTPQTHAPITLSSEFAPSGKPTTVDGNMIANRMDASFLLSILDSDCRHKPSTKVVGLMAPAWTSTPSP
ncbi:hypothetical protein ACFYZJ_37720 [Streptomyces sp. NPDC001848]|uniref:hypothetical protein n=1 Tax=Streptomyces sp. NPDC001848 TaxID=3364618 RepID=UPI0036B75175